MKKHQLLEKAMRDYPAGTIFKSVRTGIEYVSEGIFNVDTDFVVDVFALIGGKYRFSVYTDGNWAEIVPEQKPNILEGKVCIQVNNKREFKLLMQHYNDKGWMWCGEESPLGDYIPNLPNNIAYNDEFTHSCTFGGWKKIPFADFAKEVGIKVPVFIMKSEDGVDMYEGDKYIEVTKSVFDNKKSDWYIINNPTFTLTKSCRVFSDKNNSKAFTSLEAAQEWIEEQNKPKEVQYTTCGSATVRITKETVRIGAWHTLHRQDIEEIYKAYKSLQ